MKPSKTATKRRPSKAEEAEPKPSAKKRRRLEGAAAEVDERFQMRPEDEDRETTVDPPETSASKKKKKKKKAEPKGSSDANGSPAPSSKRKKKRETEDLSEEANEETFSDLDADDDDDDDARLRRQKAKREVLAERAKRKQAKRGVVYLGAIPPRMKPQKLRQLLSPFGKLDRVYLTPEDPGTRLRRKKFGGNTGKNFTEGWVEFLDKKKARSCAEMLNGTQIGGKRRSAHYSDLWMLKYLPKFKWDNLLEEIEYQKAIRDQKMQLELAVAKKERDFYLAKVEQSKQIEAMVRRRVAEGQSGDELNVELNDREETKEEYDARIAKEKRERKADREMLLRKFKQRQAVGDVNVDDGRGMMAPDVLRDLFAASAEGPKKRAG
jgi:ESF2/ABP1 family protein